MSDLSREQFQQLMGQAGGVRCAWVQAQTMQGLVDAMATTLAEHLTDDDELHVTFNAMQNGWQEHPGSPGGVFKAQTAPWTELSFEYSAFVVMRHRDAPPAAQPPSF